MQEQERCTHAVNAFVLPVGGAAMSDQDQLSPTPGPRTGPGPWINWYRAAQEMINYFRCIHYPSLNNLLF